MWYVGLGRCVVPLLVHTRARLDVMERFQVCLPVCLDDLSPATLLITVVHGVCCAWQMCSSSAGAHTRTAGHYAEVSLVCCYPYPLCVTCRAAALARCV
jgi:hypothetical protein